MQNLLDPTILFFLFALCAGLLKTNLEIPAQISRFLSLYLLMALGLKGGFALAQSGLTREVGVSLGSAVLLALLIPLLGYQVLRRLTSSYNAAAVAATYGSVSAVTFVTAVQYLETNELTYGGHMAAAMALMESPAIIIAILFANTLRLQSGTTLNNASPAGIGKILHESLTDGAQLLLLGSMLVGLISGEAGKQAMQPFAGGPFKGMLAFFLIDMGLLAARSMRQLKDQSPMLAAYALLAPMVHAAMALILASLFGISAGNAGLLMVLAASASYIAVPAVVRYAIPEANPSIYLGMSLGITFPFNILLGIPLYVGVAYHILGGA